MAWTPTVSLFQPTVTRNGTKTKTQVWWIAWRGPDGRQHRHSTGARHRAVAKQIASETERQLLLNPHGIIAPVDHPWDSVVAEFLKKHGSVLRPDTVDVYSRSLDMFNRLAKPGTVQSVTAAMIGDFAAKRIKKAVPPTVNRDLRHVRALLHWAKRRKYIAVVPAIEFVREDIGRPVVIPTSHYAKLLKALGSPDLTLITCPATWWRMFIVIAYTLGLRRGEILGLTWADVDLEQGNLHVGRETSKGRKDRDLPLLPDQIREFKRWRKQCGPVDPSDPVLPFERRTSSPYRRLYPDWHKIVAAAGLPKGTSYLPKHCRSTTASQLLLSGSSTIEARDFLGHSTVAVLEKFYANCHDGLRAAAERRQRANSGNGKNGKNE